MADITMCSGEDCPMAGTCHRVSAPQGVRQSFFQHPPFDEQIDVKDGTALYTCREYWHNGKEA